jgi:predicted nucleotidyltransferase
MHGPRPIPSDLKALADAVSTWVDEVSGVKEIYIFGSRVRGDHRPDSDVDIRVFVDQLANDTQTTVWWTDQHATCFADLKVLLPGPLGMHDRSENFDKDILNQLNVVLTVRKAVCVWLSPKPNLLG